MELKNRVEQISAEIRELRQAAAEGRNPRQLLDSIFRRVHSLKAVASANGYDDLTRLAHQFENLLHSLRTGRLKLDNDVLQVFEDTTVALNSGVEDHELPNEAALLDRFNQLSSRPTTDHSLVSLPREIGASLKDDELHRAAAAIEEGCSLYVMEAAFATNEFDERFRALKEQLEKTAEVISTWAKMKDDKIIFQVVYASESEKIPVQAVLQRAVLAGQATAKALGKQIEFVANADDLLLDKSVSEVLADALLHLVRNAVDHGIESRGTVRLEATTVAGHTQITVTDDGRGIDPANIHRLFQPGFSTATDVTEISGRGVGLDVVASAVREIGGTVSVTSEPGKGACFEITLPSPSSDA